MSRVRSFQLLVAMSVLLHCTWFFGPIASPSPEQQEALRWGGYGGVSALQQPFIYLGLLAAKIVAAIGLSLFLSWGRWVLAALLVVGVAQTPFTGIAVGLPHENLVGALTGLLDGAILALAFSSPIAEAMRKDV